MERDSLRDFYISELKTSHHAETQLVSALPAMIGAASADELRRALECDLEQTKDHATRLEMMLDAAGEETPGNKGAQLGAQLEEQTRAKKCAGMQALIAEFQALPEAGLSPDILDLALIAYAQRIEHYEIAMYGTLRDYANALGHSDTASQLQSTLEEEQNSDRQLTSIGQAITVRVASREIANEKIQPSFAEETRTTETRTTKIKPAA
jgi:ferritin-like metal-binding protein YciE